MTWKHKLSKRLSLLKDAALLVGALTACADGALTGAPDASAVDERRWQNRGPVATVTVRSPVDSLPPDSAVQFTVTLRDANGRVLSGRTVTWASGDISLATVSATGLVRSHNPGTVAITATSEGKYGSDYVIIIAPPPPLAPAPVATVVVSPATAGVQAGSHVQFIATTLDAAGQVLTGRTISWTSGDPAIASITTTGVVTGVGAGTTTITAASEGRSGTAQLTVSALALPPPPPPSTATPWLEEAFAYASTAEMLADARSIYTENEDENASRMAFDTAGADGTSNSMRFDYPDRTAVGGSGTSGRCTDYTIGRNLTLPAPVREVWAEFYVRFSANFTTRAPATWGCTSNPDLKFIFARLNGVNDRLSLKVGTGGGSWRLGVPPVGEDQFSAALSTYPAFDGRWHRVRLHFRLSTTATSADGAARLWIDDRLVMGATNLNTHRAGVVPTNIYGLALGRNMNQGPGQLQSLWWGRIRVYDSSPGW